MEHDEYVEVQSRLMAESSEIRCDLGPPQTQRERDWHRLYELMVQISTNAVERLVIDKQHHLDDVIKARSVINKLMTPSEN